MKRKDSPFPMGSATNERNPSRPGMYETLWNDLMGELQTSTD